jgi:hypothetical protein
MYTLIAFMAYPRTVVGTASNAQYGPCRPKKEADGLGHIQKKSQKHPTS